MCVRNKTNNSNNSAPAIDLTRICTLSTAKIKSIGNRDTHNHLRKLVLINTFIERKINILISIQQQQQQQQQLINQLSPLIPSSSQNVHQNHHQRCFQVVQPIIYVNQIPIILSGFNPPIQQLQIHLVQPQVPSIFFSSYNEQLYLQQHVFLPPHPRGPHAQPIHLAKLVRRPQLVRM